MLNKFAFLWNNEKKLNLTKNFNMDKEDEEDKKNKR
jgi:hypothetical protein